MATIKLKAPSGGSVSLVAGDTASDVVFTIPPTTSTIVTSDVLAAPTGSSLVGYLPAGVGAVATTVESALRASASVSVLGFKNAAAIAGDWTTAIQAAIDAVSLAGGGTVFVPPGEYICSGTLYLSRSMTGDYYNAVSLRGSGRPTGRYSASGYSGGTVLKFTGSGIALWAGDHLNDVTATAYNAVSVGISDIGIKLSATATVGILFRGCYQLRLDNVIVAGVNGSSCTGMWFQACVEGLYNLLDITFGGTSAGTLCVRSSQMYNVAGTSESMGLQSTSSTFLGGYFHNANKGAEVYGNSITFQNAKWETLINGVNEVSGGFSNAYITNYWENVVNYGIKVSSTDVVNPAGNINIIGGFAHRYDQSGNDMSGYTAANAFLQLSNAKNVKMTGVQVMGDVSLYASTADLGGVGGAAENIYLDANPGTFGRYGFRYTRDGGTGLVGAVCATTTGSAVMTVTKTGHGMIKGQVLDIWGFNKTTLGSAISKPYRVAASVIDANTFTVAIPTATATATDSSGIIKYYDDGKISNPSFPSGTIFNDCVYETFIFQATQTGPATSVTMTCNGANKKIFNTDFFITDVYLTVDNKNVVDVATFTYLYNADSVALRYDGDIISATSNLPVNSFTSPSSSSKIKLQAGQYIYAKLWDNGGSGATYPRTFNLVVTVAKTSSNPSNATP